MTTILAVILVLLTIANAATDTSAAAIEDNISWTDAKSLTVEGRGWSDTQDFYYRLPAKALGVVIPQLYGLSKQSAGLVVRFVTDSPEIRVRWKLTGSGLNMYHMPSTGVSGVDLYVKLDNKWQWQAIGIPTNADNNAVLVNTPTSENHEYALYLPLYNGVSSVEIGVAKTASIKTAPARVRDIKPVVFYGSSITQGGCASRPGMAYTAIIGRKLDCPVINLGFSGRGTCEHEISDLLAELDPSVYVIDCLPNMVPDQVDERLRYLLKALREKRPNTPVVLVEQASFQQAFAIAHARKEANPKNQALWKIYKDVRKKWGNKLYYIKCDMLIGEDGEGTVDGVHPNDLGFIRMADAMTPVIKKALDSIAVQTNKPRPRALDKSKSIRYN